MISSSAKLDRENEQIADKVREMLSALERGATRVVTAAQQAANDANEDKFKAYVAFRDYVDDFDTLAIVIEYKIKRLRDGKSEKLAEKFVELTGFMLSAIVTASLHFLRILAEKRELPLGARDVFMSELRSLYHAKERIETERYAHLLTDRTKSDLVAAEQILEIVIERAPKLLNFDD
jgi:soluble cytochrome b562